MNFNTKNFILMEKSIIDDYPFIKEVYLHTPTNVFIQVDSHEKKIRRTSGLTILDVPSFGEWEDYINDDNFFGVETIRMYEMIFNLELVLNNPNISKEEFEMESKTMPILGRFLLDRKLIGWFSSPTKIYNQVKCVLIRTLVESLKVSDNTQQLELVNKLIK